MLSSELVFLFEPIIKEAVAGLMHFRAYQGHVLVALGFVVGVEALEFAARRQQ